MINVFILFPFSPFSLHTWLQYIHTVRIGSRLWKELRAFVEVTFYNGSWSTYPSHRCLLSSYLTNQPLSHVQCCLVLVRIEPSTCECLCLPFSNLSGVSAFVWSIDDDTPLLYHERCRLRTSLLSELTFTTTVSDMLLHFLLPFHYQAWKPKLILSP